MTTKASSQTVLMQKIEQNRAIFFASIMTSLEAAPPTRETANAAAHCLTFIGISADDLPGFAEKHGFVAEHFPKKLADLMPMTDDECRRFTKAAVAELRGTPALLQVA